MERFEDTLLEIRSGLVGSINCSLSDNFLYPTTECSFFDRVNKIEHSILDQQISRGADGIVSQHQIIFHALINDDNLLKIDQFKMDSIRRVLYNDFFNKPPIHFVFTKKTYEYKLSQMRNESMVQCMRRHLAQKIKPGSELSTEIITLNDCRSVDIAYIVEPNYVRQFTSILLKFTFVVGHYTKEKIITVLESPKKPLVDSPQQFLAEINYN